MRKSSKAEETADSKNASYYRQQTTTGQPFRSPFAMLNLTAHDCQQQRAAVGMSDDDLERDKSIFNSVIDGYIAKHGYPDTNEKVDAYLALAFEFVIAGMRDSRYPQEHWPLVACHAALVTLKGAQDKKTFKVDAAMTNIALFAQAMMNIAWKPQRMQVLEQIARDSLQFANHHATRNNEHTRQIKEAQKQQSRQRHEAAEAARTLVKETLFPEWRKANPDADKTEGYRHCANVLIARGYKTANRTQITWRTVKEYFRKPRKKKSQSVA